MAHLRKPLATALGMNTAVLVVETVGGVEANSLSLLTDAVHNLSDEVALGFLVLAYMLRTGLSSHFLRSANLFNSIGLFTISGLLVWQAIERLIHPQPVWGVVPIVAGLLAAVGNWFVARALKEPSKEDLAIRLAYVHNLGDTLVSLAPVLAGVAMIVTGSSLFDSAIAILIALVIVVTTFQTVRGSGSDLMWPENVVCGGSATQSTNRGN
jgi:Co/Zn/Cd efflux system component